MPILTMLKKLRYTGDNSSKNTHCAGSAKRKQLYKKHKEYMEKTADPAHPNFVCKITCGPVIMENTPAFSVCGKQSELVVARKMDLC